MSDVAYGFPEAFKDGIAEPTAKCIDEVLKEWLRGRRISSIEIDFGDLLDMAKEAMESAFSTGLVFAAIRFVSSLIFSANREPTYWINIQMAERIYAEYGDSRWKGLKNLWWRFSILKDANVELIRAQCLAQKEGKEMDVARIVLLRGLLAQAAGVWSEADRLFERFVLQAQATIKTLEDARAENEKAQKAFEDKLTSRGKDLVETILANNGLAAAIAEDKLDRFIQRLFGDLSQRERLIIAGLVEKRLEYTNIERIIRGLQTFIAYCKYRPTLRDAIDYRIERMEVYVCRSRVFSKLRAPHRESVVRVLGGMRRKNRRPTLENMQRKARLLTNKAG
jgi:hypothetical protein